MSLNPQLVPYYLNLLALQYKNKPNLTSLLTAVVTKMIIADLIIKVRDGYNINTATGPQLDILAKYAGVSRIVSGIPFFNTGFGYLTYIETPPVLEIGPYGQYAVTPPTTEVFFQYATSPTEYSMTDAQLSQVLPGRILLNYSGLSLADFDNVLFGLFGANYDIIETAPMTVSFTVKGSANVMTGQNAQASGIFTPPMGVKASISLSS